MLYKDLFFNFFLFLQMIKFTLLNTGKFPNVNGVFSNLKDVYSSVSNHACYIVLIFYMLPLLHKERAAGNSIFIFFILRRNRLIINITIVLPLLLIRT